MANMNDPSREIVNGRGNLSFTSINLPRLGILADHNVDVFFAELDKMVDLVFEQLLERLEIQSCKKCKNYPFLMGQGSGSIRNGSARSRRSAAKCSSTAR